MVNLKCWKKVKGVSLSVGKKVNSRENESKGKMVQIRKKKDGTFHTSVGTKKGSRWVAVSSIQSSKTRNMKNPAIIDYPKETAVSLANKYMKEHDKC